MPRAFSSPMSLGRRCVPPKPGMIPAHTQDGLSQAWPPKMRAMACNGATLRPRTELQLRQAELGALVCDAGVA